MPVGRIDARVCVSNPMSVLFQHHSISHERRRDDDQHERNGHLTDDEHAAQFRSPHARRELAAQRTGQSQTGTWSAGRSAKTIVARAATIRVKRKTR